MTWKILISIMTPALCLLILIFGVTYAVNPEKLTDKFKEKCTAEEAITAWKQGKMIHRSGEEYPYFYSSVDITINGKTTRHYGRIEKDKTLSKMSFIKFEDLLENDWIIDESPKDLQLKIQ